MLCLENHAQYDYNDDVIMKFEVMRKFLRGQVIVFLAIALGFLIVFGGDWLFTQIQRLFGE